MKKTLILLLLYIGLQQTFAQNIEKTSASTQSNHIADAGWIGASYSYEYAFADKFTVSGIAGIAGYVSYTSSDFFGDYWSYAFHPYMAVEPRYYYNLEKRLHKGKKTDGNAGSFLAAQCGYIFKPVKKHNVYDDVCGISFAPYWGLRRIWWNHLLFEFQAGLAFGWNSYNDSKAGIRLGVRFGYKF
jgi:hypothetical protein